ncbi:hypothetical protein JCM10207_002180 [Rhodosporidiobolus poonsookiae]
MSASDVDDPHRSFGSLASLSGLGGGRVDGGFLAEPGSYEDFQYPSAFDYSSYSAHTPTAAGGPSRPFSPFSSAHHRIASNPFSPLPSFSPYPTYGSPTSSSALPPAPPTPPPLFDEGETALFSSFLNTIDVDPNFLFNPVLPPGMPSPPSASMHPSAEGEADRRERDRLGAEVDGLSLGRAPLPSLPREPPDARSPPPGKKQVQYAEMQNGEEEDDGDETARPEPEDDDPDFELRPAARGTRRKSRSSGGAATSGKKARVQTSPPAPVVAAALDEDVEMASPGLGEDGADDSVATVTASGRPKRATRAPRRLSTSVSRPAAAQKTASHRAANKVVVATAPPLTLTAGAAYPPFPPSAADASPDDADADADADASPPPPPVPSRSRARVPAADSASPVPSSHSGSGGVAGPSKAPLTESEKRSNHIASEQRRRNAIKCGFQDLVDLLVAGQEASGIVLGPEGGGGEEEGAGKKGKGKGKTGRGRGRKGEVQTNASKSVVLAQAANYLLWLERGNLALEREVERVEGRLREVGVVE